MIGPSFETRHHPRLNDLVAVRSFPGRVPGSGHSRVGKKVAQKAEGVRGIEQGSWPSQKAENAAET